MKDDENKRAQTAGEIEKEDCGEEKVKKKTETDKKAKIQIEKKQLTENERRNEKVHNTTYCRDWVADTNLNLNPNETAQSDGVEQVSDLSSKSDDLLNVTSVSRNVQGYKGKPKDKKAAIAHTNKPTTKK